MHSKALFLGDGRAGLCGSIMPHFQLILVHFMWLENSPVTFRVLGHLETWLHLPFGYVRLQVISGGDDPIFLFMHSLQSANSYRITIWNIRGSRYFDLPPTPYLQKLLQLSPLIFLGNLQLFGKFPPRSYRARLWWAEATYADVVSLLPVLDFGPPNSIFGYHAPQVSC